MPSNRKPKVQEDAPSASLVSMLSLLHERCPVLCPSVIPSGLADGEHGVALLALCEDVAEKQALASLLQAARGSVGSCALTAREVDNAELRFVSLWELQPVSATCVLRRCAFVCAEAALLLDTPAMLERFSRVDADAKELARLAHFFCAANARPDEPERTALDERVWLQECLNLATACQVVASALPQRWSALDPEGEPLRGRSAASIAKAMLGREKKVRPRAAAVDDEAEGEAQAEARTPKAKGSSQKKKKRKSVESG